jgi:DNA invertase Pin-like site-specific DNA recombinase
MRLVGYCRVSTAEQGSSGLGLQAQSAAIQEAADRRGDVLVDIITEVASGGKHDRAGLEQALAMCGTEADGLIVAKLDRATRSLSHFATIMDRSRREGWAFVALDLGVDTSTPAGELVANVMASVAQWERSVISERTRAALAVARASGRLSKPQRACDPGVVSLLLEMRSQGLTLAQTARRLEETDAPTAQGGRWTARTVKLLEDKHRKGVAA